MIVLVEALIMEGNIFFIRFDLRKFFTSNFGKFGT
jgi:hypothetical protein